MENEAIRPPTASRVRRRNMKVYEVPNSAGLDSWLAKIFHVRPMSTANELLASFEPFSLPTIYYLPYTSEILIQVSRWCIDGMRVLQLLNNFFKALAKPRQLDFCNERKNLSPSLDEAAAFPSTATDQEDQAAAKFLMEYARNTPSIGLSINPSSQVGATRRVEVTFPQALTSAFINACKFRSLSVATAFHSALIVATKQLAPHET